eukprot:7265307-Ditylum_brightwellii.AAC.2
MADQSEKEEKATDPCLLPPGSIPTADSNGNTRALYSDVETLCVANKQLNSYLSDTVNAVAGYTYDRYGYKSSCQQSVASYESIVVGGST